MSGLTSAGAALLNLLLALLLSFLLLVERNRIRAIGKTIEKSRISLLYRYFVLFGGSFCVTFGKVMKVQVIIAAINCGISVLYLTVTGFPNILALGIMIFVLGLIPVAGAFISLIPLCITAFYVGGALKIIEVLIMIAIIHCIEAYFLNPKLMSQKTHLPVSIVFIVLIVAQNYLGAWGLLIGVPVFIYLLSVLDIQYHATHSKTYMETNESGDAREDMAPIIPPPDIEVANKSNRRTRGRRNRDPKS
jgi:predicted PurR-regulated permease PerM